MQTAREMLDERTTINEGLFKGAKITFPTMDIVKLMEEYHEAKLKEITDADIEAWAEKKQRETLFKNEFGMDVIHHYDRFDLIEGAKAALNGEIKHIEEQESNLDGIVIEKSKDNIHWKKDKKETKRANKLLNKKQ